MAQIVKPESTEAFATRLPTNEAERLKKAVEEAGCTEAEFLRQAIRYYIDQNPDQITAFCPEESLERFVSEVL